MTRKARAAVQTAVSAAFRDLESLGYFARGDWTCCNTCGVAAVPEHYADRFVFYHAQSADDLRERGEVWLNWAGDAELIIRALRRQGLTVEWNGNPNRKIHVSGRGALQ